MDRQSQKAHEMNEEARDAAVVQAPEESASIHRLPAEVRLMLFDRLSSCITAPILKEQALLLTHSFCDALKASDLFKCVFYVLEFCHACWKGALRPDSTYSSQALFKMMQHPQIASQVLLLVLSCVESPTDLCAVFRTCKGMRALSEDPHLKIQWMLNFPSQMGLRYALQQMKRGDIAIQLLQRGVSATEALDNWLHRAPLKVAAMTNLPDVVLFLWLRDDVRSDLKAAAHALCLAAGDGHIECMEILLKSPSPLTANCIAPNHWTPMQFAASYGQLEALQFLLAQSPPASCTVRDQAGRSALLLVCEGEDGRDTQRAATVRAILGAPDGRGTIDTPFYPEIGRTPLWCAAFNGLREVCEVLLSSGSQVIDVPDCDGYSPYQIAGRRGHSDVQMLLAQFGADRSIE